MHLYIERLVFLSGESGRAKNPTMQRLCLINARALSFFPALKHSRIAELILYLSHCEASLVSSQANHRHIFLIFFFESWVITLYILDILNPSEPGPTMKAIRDVCKVARYTTADVRDIRYTRPLRPLRDLETLSSSSVLLFVIHYFKV